jgi:transcriptional regulator with XRE-family HTH domain
MKIGSTIQYLRKNKGFKQGVFAELIGISATSLSQIERNVTSPKKHTLDKICKNLNISSEVLNLLSINEEDVPKENRQLYEAMYPQVKEMMLKIFSKQDNDLVS